MVTVSEANLAADAVVLPFKLRQINGLDLENNYDYFTHADELDETTLPLYETFYCTIEGFNILEEEYAMLHSKSFSTKENLNKKPQNPSDYQQNQKTGPENYQWLQHLWTENLWSTLTLWATYAL